MTTMIPFTPETVAVQRPTFESIADDLEAYQESLAMIEAEIATEKDDGARDAAIDERVSCLRDIERISEALVKKTDDLASVLRRMKADSTFLKSEETRLHARRKAVDEALDRLKGYTQSTMERHAWKHLKTAKNTITIRGNGGVQPLVISQPDLVPPELCVYRLEVDHATLGGILEAVEECRDKVTAFTLEKHITRVPSNSLIREALIQPCAACDGTGRVVCSSPVSDMSITVLCSDCGGTGKNAVPGAHLQDRGCRVEVR